MISKRLALLPLMLSITMISIGPAFAQESASSTSSMTVEGTCGVTIGTALDFGLVTPDFASDEGILDITGTGSAPSIVSTFATDWLDGSNNIIVDGKNRDADRQPKQNK